eukprot:gene37180-50169_t
MGRVQTEPVPIVWPVMRDELVKVFPLGIPLSGLGVGHLLTTVRGWQCWEIVTKNNRTFLYVCCGVWADEASVAFEISMVSQSMLSTDDVQGTRVHRRPSSTVLCYDGLLTMLMLSICATPLFVTNSQMKRRDGRTVFPKLFFTYYRPWEVARNREAGEVGLDLLLIDRDYKWVLFIRTLIIVGTESLLFCVMNTIIFAICVIIFLFS